MKNDDKKFIIKKYFFNANDIDIYIYCVGKYRRNQSVLEYIENYPLSTTEDLVKYIYQNDVF